MTFKYVVKPEFSGAVEIPVPGETPQQCEFIFRHQKRSQFDALAQKLQDKQITVDDAVVAVVSGWKIDGKDFSEQALRDLFDDFPGASIALWLGYRDLLVNGKRKN